MAERITRGQISRLTREWKRTFSYDARSRRMLTELLQLIVDDVDLRGELEIFDLEKVVFSDGFNRLLIQIANRDVERRMVIDEYSVPFQSIALALFHLAEDRPTLIRLMENNLKDRDFSFIKFLDKD